MGAAQQSVAADDRRRDPPVGFSLPRRRGLRRHLLAAVVRSEATGRRSPLNGKSLYGRRMLWLGVSLLGIALALLNVRGTLRLWRSCAYERGQLLAQTALIWLLPGSVFVVTYILKDDRPGRALDPTASNPETPNATIVAAGPGAP
jgi:hypothetical protein